MYDVWVTVIGVIIGACGIGYLVGGRGADGTTSVLPLAFVRVAAGAYGVTMSGAGSAIVAITPLAERAAVADAVAAVLTAAGTTTEVLTPDVAVGGLSVTSER